MEKLSHWAICLEAISRVGAAAVSTNGMFVVGSSSSVNGDSEAFLWSQANGMIGLGDLPGGNFASSASWRIRRRIGREWRRRDFGGMD